VEKIQHSVSGAGERSTQQAAKEVGGAVRGEGRGREGSEDEGVGGGEVVLEMAG